MSTISKERVKDILVFGAGRIISPITDDEIRDLARIALASLEAEPVCVIDQSNLDYLKSGSDADVWPASRTEMGDVLLYRAVVPAPVSLPDEVSWEDVPEEITEDDMALASAWAHGFNQCRAAMLQGADTELQRKAAIHDSLCEKYNVESLADFVDWQRNHIAELEAAPPAPVGEGETAVMPDYPGYTMTQRECFQAGKKAGLAEAGNYPVIPDGYALVPIEPTAEMQSAAAGVIRFDTTPINKLWTGNAVYRAMIAAAPQQEV